MPGACNGAKKLVLVVRHGEAQHNIKRTKKRDADEPIDPQLGPLLTPLGNQQAEAAGRAVAQLLEKSASEFGLDGGEQPVILSSNLLRALETALQVASPGGEVQIQPMLRERIANEYDEPVELETLRSWAETGGAARGVTVGFEAYEEALAAEGGSHAAYKESCWACDCVRAPDGKSWTNKENKWNLKERASKMTAWLESHSARVFVLVGHSVFLPRITGDSGMLQNGEVRGYHLSGGVYQRAGAGKPALVAAAAAAAVESNAPIRPVLSAGIRPVSGSPIRPVRGPNSLAAGGLISNGSASLKRPWGDVSPCPEGGASGPIRPLSWGKGAAANGAGQQQWQAIRPRPSHWGTAQAAAAAAAAGAAGPWQSSSWPPEPWAATAWQQPRPRPPAWAMASSDEASSPAPAWAMEAAGAAAPWGADGW